MSTTTADPAAPPAPGGTAETGFTHRQILVILSGLMLGMFLAALDQNIVSTSIRTIADDLNGLNLQAWATTAYLITATISTPLYGKLSDLYGRKPFFLLAIGLFVVGSVLCTISTSMYELAGFRALQGLGAGGLMSLALTIIGDIVPPRERARYQGFFLAVFGTSSVLGPIIGGFFAGTPSIIGITGWRWVFLVNVPIGLLAFFVVWRVLNLPHNRREHRIDWPGASALAVGLVPLLIVAEQGRDWGWSSGYSITCYVIGVVGFIGFVLAERHYGEDALLPLRLFRNGVFSLTSIVAVITGIGLFGGIAILPQYLQIVTGSTPTKAGLQLIPLVGGLMVGSIVSGQLISRTGRYKIFPVVGLGLMTAGLFLLHFLLRADTPYWEVALLMVVFGLGLGNCMQTLVLAVQNAVPPKDMGVATASATFFRQMGGTLGVAIFLSVLFSTVGTNIRDQFVAAAASPAFRAALADPAVRANPANLPAINPAAGASSIVQDSSVLQQMDPRLAAPFLRGFADSMDLVFLIAGCVIAVGFVLIFFLKEVPLRQQSGIQARDAESRQVGEGESGPAIAALAAPTDVAPVAASAVSGPSELADDGHDARHGSHEVLAGHEGHDGHLGSDSHDSHDGQNGHPDAGRGRHEWSGSDAVTGRVVSTGDGVDGVTVTLHDLEGTVLDRAVSDADGTFALHGDAEHTAVLIVSSPRHRPHAQLVRPSGTTTLNDVELDPSADAAGRVTDSDGRPVGGATVTLTDASGDVRAVRTTGPDGRWVADGLTAGEHTVVVLAGGAPAAGSVRVGTGGTGRHEAVVPAARHELTGVLRSSTGRPVPESLVVLVGEDGSVTASTVTDDHGRFRLDGLVPGRHMLTASGFAPVTDEVTVSGGDPAPVELVVSAPRPVEPTVPAVPAERSDAERSDAERSDADRSDGDLSVDARADGDRADDGPATDVIDVRALAAERAGSTGTAEPAEPADAGAR